MKPKFGSSLISPFLPTTPSPSFLPVSCSSDFKIFARLSEFMPTTLPSGTPTGQVGYMLRSRLSFTGHHIDRACTLRYSNETKANLKAGVWLWKRQ